MPKIVDMQSKTLTANVVGTVLHRNLCMNIVESEYYTGPGCNWSKAETLSCFCMCLCNMIRQPWPRRNMPSQTKHEQRRKGLQTCKTGGTIGQNPSNSVGL